jgi:hypothetical protein
MANQLDGYSALQRQVSDENDDVWWVDVEEGLVPFVDESLLVDRNHLSRAGGQRLAEVITPTLVQMMGWPAAVEHADEADTASSEAAEPTVEPPP